jgi:anti-sigma-K factor RskA
VKIVREDLHVLTGSYALDALSESERADFERHLEHCSSCEAEVRGLRETAARLAMAKTVRPPAAMEPRVLAAAYQVRQLPPQGAARARGEHRGARVSRLFASRPASRRPGREPAMRLRMPRLVAAAAAASVAVAVGLGITQIDTQHQLDSARASNVAITKVVQAPDARLESRQTAAGGTVSVVFSGQQRAAVITTSKMEALPPGRVYQLWVMDPVGARSVGLLAKPGQTNQVLAAGVLAGDRIGITVEPAGGTSSPTTTPVLAVLLNT